MKQDFSVCVLVCALSFSSCTATKSGYLEKGNRMFAAGKYAEASLNYRKVIQKDPQFGEAYYRLGLTAIKQDNSREAYDALNRAVLLLPENIDAKEKLAAITLSYYLLDPRHPQNLYSQVSKLS